MTSVVAGFDRTEGAAAGLLLAQEISRLTARPLEVVEVVSRHGVLPEDVHGRIEALKETREEVERLLRGEKPEITALPHRSAEEALAHLGDQPDVGIVVLGATHHGPLGRLILGTAAEYIVPHATCPVAVAPPGFLRLEPAVVGVALDGTEAALAALDFAADLAAGGGLELRLITVGKDASVLEKAQQRVAATHPDLEVTSEARDGHAADVLIGLTERELGCLVAGRHEHRALRRVMLGTVATKLVRRAHAPVIVV